MDKIYQPSKKKNKTQKVSNKEDEDSDEGYLEDLEDEEQHMEIVFESALGTLMEFETAIKLELLHQAALQQQKQVLSSTGINDNEDQNQLASLSQEEVEALMEEAEDLLDTLQEAEERLIRFHLGRSKLITCQFCETKTRSLIEEKNSTISYLICVILFLLISWMSFIFIPFVFGLLRQQIHRCPKCLNQIKEKSVFSALEDNILSVQIGKFGILIKRRTLGNWLVIIVLAILTYYLLNTYYIKPQLSLQQQINYGISWNQYLRECGHSIPQQRALVTFNRHYVGQNIQWSGYVLRIDLNEEQNQASVLLQMNPRDVIQNEQQVNNHRESEPDVLLQFNYQDLQRSINNLDELHRGDLVQFNATIHQIGISIMQDSMSKYSDNDENAAHILQCHGIKKLSSPDKNSENIQPHIHWDGRFQFNQDLINEDFQTYHEQNSDKQ